VEKDDYSRDLYEEEYIPPAPHYNGLKSKEMDLFCEILFSHCPYPEKCDWATLSLYIPRSLPCFLEKLKCL
jgi:NADPH-dependent 7-cyano-7-deazaguanine reductase QueF